MHKALLGSIVLFSSRINTIKSTRLLSSAVGMTKTVKSKRILFVRHGQAEHNPRAEAAREEGCSYERFLELMKEDDVLDAKLTKLGENQAMNGQSQYETYLQGVELVVSSPLSRALKTADLVACPSNGIRNIDGGKNYFPARLCVEEFREINGWLLNAQRRQRQELQNLFHDSWNFDLISENDETWTEELESQSNCAERGYLGLLFLMKRQEDKILVVAHGGILRFCMVDHPLVQVIDERPDDAKRFANCELREYSVELRGDDDRPLVVLTEIMEK